MAKRKKRSKFTKKLLKWLRKRAAFIIVVLLVAIGGSTYLIVSHADSYTCPGGYSLSGTTCTETTTYTATQSGTPTITYSCPSGYTLSDTTCSKTTITSGGAEYTCPNGGTLDGTTCLITSGYSYAPEISNGEPNCANQPPPFVMEYDSNTGTYICYAQEPEPATLVYVCPSGYTGGGSSSECTQTTKKAATQTDTANYVCNAGDTSYQSGSTVECKHVSTVAATAVSSGSPPPPTPIVSPPSIRSSSTPVKYTTVKQIVAAASASSATNSATVNTGSNTGSNTASDTANYNPTAVSNTVNTIITNPTPNNMQLMVDEDTSNPKSLQIMGEDDPGELFVALTVDSSCKVVSTTSSKYTEHCVTTTSN